MAVEKASAEVYYSVPCLHNEEKGKGRVEPIVMMEDFGRAHARLEDKYHGFARQRVFLKHSS